MKRIALMALGVLLAGGMWSGQSMIGHAEEESAGYHEYVTTEDEAIDNWYAIARGTYLRGGTSGIKRAGTALVSVSGTTNANSVCDKVKVSVHLDESSDGGSHFGTIGNYYFQEDNTTSCHGSKANISVTKGWKYRVRGGHSVTEGSTTESSSTCTNTLTAS